MGGFKFFAMFSAVHAVLILTVSFFVLFAVEKAHKKILKTFGNILAMLLWVTAAIVLITGVYSCVKHCNSSGYMMNGMKGGMSCPMMKQDMNKIPEATPRDHTAQY